MQPLTYVLGIDPGVSTGIAFAFKHDNQWKYSTSTCQTPQDVWDHIKPATHGRMVVVIERFHAQLISKYGLHTVAVIGGVESLCWLHGIELVKDTPQQRRPYLALARHMVPKGEHRTIHEVDAMSHVVRYLHHQGIISSLQVPA